MSSVVKISDAASLALHAMVYLAARAAAPSSAGEMAKAFCASKAHLSKVLQWLARAGLVRSVRGPKGGFVLAQPAGEVTLLRVYEAVEGPLEPARCLLGSPACNGQCILGDLLESIDMRVRRRLEATALSDLAHVFAGRLERRPDGRR